MKEKNKQTKRRIIRYHLFSSILFLVTYLAAGLFDQSLLFADINTKARVAGASVNALVKIFDVPEKVILTASDRCEGQAPQVLINWNLEDDATTYDIYRNDAELVVGLTENSFTDKSVNVGINYTYYVDAIGPEGKAKSDTVSIMVSECKPNLEPKVEIVAFNGKTNLANIPTTTKEKPVFSGLTNIPNAKVELRMEGENNLFATTIANSNGFWQWIPPVDLKEGVNSLYVTAIDPLDSKIQTITSFRFRIKKRSQANAENEKTNIQKNITEPRDSTIPPSGNQAQIEKPTPSLPNIETSLDAKTIIKGVNVNENVFRGENLNVNVQFGKELKQGEKIKMKYIVYDSTLQIVAEYNDEFIFEKNVSKNIPISYKLALGKYKIQTTAVIDGMVASNENYFVVKDRPLIKLSSEAYISYADIVSNIGWIALTMTITLIFYGLLTFWDIYLAQHALVKVTEKFLKKKGFIN